MFQIYYGAEIPVIKGDSISETLTLGQLSERTT